METLTGAMQIDSQLECLKDGFPFSRLYPFLVYSDLLVIVFLQKLAHIPDLYTFKNQCQCPNLAAKSTPLIIFNEDNF